MHTPPTCSGPHVSTALKWATVCNILHNYCPFQGVLLNFFVEIIVFTLFGRHMGSGRLRRARGQQFVSGFPLSLIVWQLIFGASFWTTWWKLDEDELNISSFQYRKESLLCLIIRYWLTYGCNFQRHITHWPRHNLCTLTHIVRTLYISILGLSTVWLCCMLRHANDNLFCNISLYFIGTTTSGTAV